jgi:hypothetical protein
MIWNVYRYFDQKPCAVFWFCRYSTAESRAFAKFGREVMVLGWLSDYRRRRAEKFCSHSSDSVRLPYKGGPCT